MDLNNVLKFCSDIKSKKWESRQWFVRPINSTRIEKGLFSTTFQEMKEDPDLFFQYSRMDLETFTYLKHLLEKSLRKRKRVDVISVEERVILTIRYLASGDEIISLAIQHRIGESTARQIVYNTCSAIYNTLSPIYLRPPVQQVWRNISKGFERDWNLPNCIGAVDVDIGAYGGESDGGILARSEFGRSLQEGILDIPSESKKLPNSDFDTPYFFVGDEAFQLKSNFMRPYPGRQLDKKKRIFNYRLSRARRCIENAFGILVARWRIFERPISCHPHHTDVIVKAAVCLHNFLMSQTQKYVRNLYCPDDFVTDENNDTIGHGRIEVNADNYNQSSSRQGQEIRNRLAEYFSSVQGQVPWQDDYINQGTYREA